MVAITTDTTSDTGRSPVEREPWLRRPAASDRLFAGDQRVSTAAASTAPNGSPEGRELGASVIHELAFRLVIPLFVGTADPALATAPLDVPAVAGR